jgi:hypothetical protein
VGPEEFQRALITILVGGSIAIAVGTTGVILMLRGFGKKPGGTMHIAIAVGLIAFILICCGILFFLSYREI